LDNRIEEILYKEKKRQLLTVELIASENFASDAVMELNGSIFTNKYAEGYPENRYYNGCKHMDEIETLAIDQLKEIYGCEYANVQPHSGANANTAIYNAFLSPGDKLLGMDLSSGGHLTHGAKVAMPGKLYDCETYGVDENGLIDMEEVLSLAIKHKPKMIVAGASAYPRQIDWKGFRQIANEVGAYLLVDMAHYSGLVAGNVYDSPMKYAHFVTSTTHKTLRGPSGGIIMWNEKIFTKKINGSIFPGTQGGPLMNTIAAKAQCFIEANTPEFSVYAKSVVENAQEMCRVFAARGIKTQTNGTDSHIVLIDLSDSDMSGREAADLLEENSITVNKNGIPNDPRSFTETSGIRIGTAAETTRGYDLEDFNELAHTICDILLDE